MKFIPGLFFLKGTKNIFNLDEYNFSENDILTSLPKTRYAVETAALS